MDQSSDGGSAANTTTRPYLIRALHEWCTDNGFTPYIAVFVDRHVQVPNEYVSNNEIVLNLSYDATSSMELGNDFIRFKARFGGVAREIVVPVGHVVAVYARENGQGMAFPAPTAETPSSGAALSAAPLGASAPAPVAPASQAGPRGLRLAPEPAAGAPSPATADVDGGTPSPEDGGPASSGRPTLKRIK